MKALLVLSLLFPISSFAYTQDDIVRTERKDISGNWERGRDRAKKSWGWSCRDFTDDVKDRLPKKEDIKEINCGLMRCEWNGKLARCTSNAKVVYVIMEKPTETP